MEDKIYVAEILTRYSNGEVPAISEAHHLMKIEPDTIAFYWLLAAAGQKSTGDDIRDRKQAVEKLLTWRQSDSAPEALQ